MKGYEFSMLYALMFIGSILLTAFTVLSAKEQSDRQKNSGLGTLASSIVSILIAMFEKNNHNSTDILLIAYSFGGCALGAALGWVIIYFIVRRATGKDKILLIDLLYTGLSGVKEEIVKDTRRRVLRSLSSWNMNFEQTMASELQQKIN